MTIAEPDEILTRIGHGIELTQQGRPTDARRLFAELWELIGADGDPLHRCALAHWMADVQEDSAEELDWDLRALEAADSVTDARIAEAGVAGLVNSLLPSLHLNLGEDYRRLGDGAAARRHLEWGQVASRALGDDGYSAFLRGGLDRLADRLSST